MLSSIGALGGSTRSALDATTKQNPPNLKFKCLFLLDFYMFSKLFL
jgi:hypothetical protein